jgi:hypothetical protein
MLLLIAALYLIGSALAVAASIVNPLAIPTIALVGVGCGFMMRAWEVSQ